MHIKFHSSEEQEHYAEKEARALKYRAAGFPIVLTEQRHCDVVAGRIENGRFITYCIEIERSDKNVLRNIRRNLSLHGDRVVIVCMGAPVERLIQRKLNSLKPHERSRVEVITAG